MVLFCIGVDDTTLTVSAVSAWSGTDPTFTDAAQPLFNGVTSTLLLDLAFGLSITGAATGARTATLDQPRDSAAVLAALIPAGAPFSPDEDYWLGARPSMVEPVVTVF